MNVRAPLPRYVRGHVWEHCVGSLPVLLAQEPESVAAVVASFVAISLALAGMPVPWPMIAMGSLLLAAWLLLICIHAVFFERWRVQSRSADFTSVVVVPENPWLLCRLLRRSGHAATWRPNAVAVHVNERWRPPPGVTPREAAAEFGRQYRSDYDRLLATLAGHAVLVFSSTFNRHESAWTRRAAAEGWCRVWDGPLFRSAPGRNRPPARLRVQRGMFGGVVSGRRVDRPEAWRTRVFDCLRHRLMAGASRRGVGVCVALEPSDAGPLWRNHHKAAESVRIEHIGSQNLQNGVGEIPRPNPGGKSDQHRTELAATDRGRRRPAAKCDVQGHEDTMLLESQFQEDAVVSASQP